MSVNYEKKRAVVRFDIGKALLDQILKRYAGSPYNVTAAGPLMTVFRSEQVTVRAWADPAELIDATAKETSPPATIAVEFVPSGDWRIAEPPVVTPAENLSEIGLKRVGDVTEVNAADVKPPLDPGARRFHFALRPQSRAAPGSVSVLLHFRYVILDPDGTRHDGAGRLQVPLEMVATRAESSPAVSPCC